MTQDGGCRIVRPTTQDGGGQIIRAPAAARGRGSGPRDAMLRLDRVHGLCGVRGVAGNLPSQHMDHRVMSHSRTYVWSTRRRVATGVSSWVPEVSMELPAISCHDTWTVGCQE
ncbi:hypothetical protein VPH35_081628 [Triticum aestivum]